MPKPAISADINQTTDILLDFPAKVALHLIILGNFVTELGNVGRGKIFDACRRIHLSLGKDLDCERTPVTQNYADKIGADGYAADAATAVDVAKRLLD